MLKCLLLVGIILFGFNVNWCLCEKGLKKLIRVDKSKLPEMSCNDHLERIVLNVNFFNNSIGSLYLHDDKFAIEYTYDKCGNKACVFQKLAEFNANNTSFRLIVNVNYEYKLEIFLINKASRSLSLIKNKSINANETDKSFSYKNVCVNNLNFTKFKNCEEYNFNIYENGICELNRIRKYELNSLVIYFYFLIISLLFINIVLVLSKFFFNKYRRLR